MADAIAQRLYDELHAPDGVVPTLDDYTPILRELRLRDAPKPSQQLPPNIRSILQVKAEPQPGSSLFLHYNANTSRWVVSAELYPLQGFVWMRAPDGQQGFVFHTYVDAAKVLGAVEANG